MSKSVETVALPHKLILKADEKQDFDTIKWLKLYYIVARLFNYLNNFTNNMFLKRMGLKYDWF